MWVYKCLFEFLLSILLATDPEAELLNPVILCLVFWGTTITFSTEAAPFYIPISDAQGFQFLHILTNTWYFLFFFFFITVILMDMKWCPTVVFCIFLMISEWCWAPFHVLIGHLHIFFVEVFIQVLWPFFNQVVCFLLLSCRSSLHILNINPLSDIFILSGY